MDRIPAACAMEWSIRLEKSLRSGKTGQSIEAIRELGRGLEWWNGDSELSAAACRMFNLIPREDKFFLNAIFLRLAEAFRLGNKQIKTSIAALFLRMRKERERGGILNVAKLENYAHLLKKVQQVYDEGGVEERALALALLGSWAELAKESAGVRYIVLSSLVSSHVVEMKAGLFAAGCLCELSDHFAFVFLEVISSAFLSECISREMKLYGAKVFSKLCRSSSLAEKAYKVGLKHLMDSHEDDFSAVMLISLTKIASKWMLLLPAQIELLLSSLSEERSPPRLQLASLKCLRLLLAEEEGSSCLLLLSNPEMHDKLLGVLNRPKTHELQLQALRILHKILPVALAASSFEEITETIRKQLVVVKDMLRSSRMSIRVLPIDILADLCGKVLGGAKAKATTPVEAAVSLASVLISFILDRLFQLVTAHADDIRASAAESFEVKRLLYSLSTLVGKHPEVPRLLLKSISSFISDFVTKTTDTMRRTVESDVLVSVSKIAASCMAAAFEAPDAEMLRILDVLKLQAENVCHCGHFGSFTCLLYALLLHQHSSICGSRNAPVLLLEDRYASDFADKMLARNSCWNSYKAGKIAACQGAWSTAASVFSQLTPKVQSPSSSSSWLEFLSLFSTSERQLQLFLLKGVSLETRRRHEHTENLLTASDALSTAKRVLLLLLLAASDTMCTFRFQIWFSELRANFLTAVVDAIELLDGYKNPVSCSSICTEVSLRWHALAKEFDLLSMIFTGMDIRSRMIISALTLSCSLMAFTVGFAFLVPDMDSHSGKFKLCVPEKRRQLALFLEDLIMRIRSSESRKKLLTLLKRIGEDGNCLRPSKLPCFCSDAAALTKLCEYSIGEIVGSSSKRAENGSYLLSTVVSEMMLIPFQTPKHFFSTGPSVSSELFVMNEDGKALHRTSITPGAQLRLNLCLQLKNFTSIVPAKVIVYLILACQETVGSGNIESEAKMSCRDEQIDDMIELNEKLWNYVIHGGNRTSAFDSSSSTGSHRYARFELNERGQGFSTCILDVSDLHPGCCYRIKWQCGYINTEGFCCSLLPENSGQPLFTILEQKIPLSTG